MPSRPHPCDRGGGADFAFGVCVLSGTPCAPAPAPLSLEFVEFAERSFLSA